MRKKPHQPSPSWSNMGCIHPQIGKFYGITTGIRRIGEILSMISQQSRHDTILRRGYERCVGLPVGKPRCCCHIRKKHLRKLTETLHFYITIDLILLFHTFTHKDGYTQYTFMYTCFCTKTSWWLRLMQVWSSAGFFLLWRSSLGALRVFFQRRLAVLAIGLWYLYLYIGVSINGETQHEGKSH